MSNVYSMLLGSNVLWYCLLFCVWFGFVDEIVMCDYLDKNYWVIYVFLGSYFVIVLYVVIYNVDNICIYIL